MEKENEVIDVKKIMNSIRTKAQSGQIKPDDLLTTNVIRKNYLAKLVIERKKSSQYDELKKYLASEEAKVSIKTEWQELEHNLHKTNLSVEINHVEPIVSGRNKAIRWLALKIRKIIQSEIRFTLDPIIRKQIQHNAYSAKTLNEVSKTLKLHEELIDNYKSSITKNSVELSNQKNELTGLNSELSNQKKDIFKINEIIKPNLNWRYLEFENKFRGPEEEIRDRQLKYLDFIKTASKNNPGKHFVDVGCGRGEFMTILAGNKIAVKGIDSNPTMVQFNVERNRQAELADANSFLESLQDNTLTGISAFQVVEHFSNDYLLKFLQNSYKKIAKGGVMILETVNPMSVFSLMHFWYDVSHNKPIPPDVLKFYSEMAGFNDVQILFLSETPKELKLNGTDDNTKKLNEILFGPQDYAIIAWKK